MKKLLFVLVVLAACTKKQAAEKTVEEIPAVGLVSVSEQALSHPVVGSGVLSSKSELKLGFKTGGMIKRVFVNEGQNVAEGQLLAELDLSEIEAQVGQTQLGLAKAQRDADRVKNLYADSIATYTQLQDATTALELAQKTSEIARFNQKLSKIYAPAAGRILRKIADQGELITPFAPALILATGNSAYIVNIGLSDTDIVKVKIGDMATIKLDAYPGEIFKASVTQIAQSVNPSTGTFELELQIENTKNKRLISGFVAKAEIAQNAAQTGLVIPIESLIEAESDFAYVFVYQATSKRVQKKQIQIGKIYGSNVAVLAGLAKGDQLVTAGANFLFDNAQVTVN
jgi:RND family efflux transporter MFP subunit